MVLYCRMLDATDVEELALLPTAESASASLSSASICAQCSAGRMPVAASGGEAAFFGDDPEDLAGEDLDGGDAFGSMTVSLPPSVSAILQTGKKALSQI